MIVNQPPDNLVVRPNQSFLVAGRATADVSESFHSIDSVTVQVDDQPPIDAVLTPVPPRGSGVYSYAASAQVAGGQDPHTVAVTATDDQGRSTKRILSVFTGPVFKVAPPALLIDLAPFDLDPKKVDEWVSEVQQQLVGLSNLLDSAGKMVAGPNVFSTTNDRDVPVLRFGIWIEDLGFPVLPPSPPRFRLPRLIDEAAAAGFDTVPLLPVPAPTGFAPAFAISVPTTTLQGILDALAPVLREAASQGHAALTSLTVTASPPSSVLTTVSGTLPFGVPFSIGIAEMLGTEQQPNPVEPDVMHTVPAVIGSSHWSSTGDALDWFLSLLSPVTFLALSYASGQVSDVSGQAGQQVNGVVRPLLAGLPPSILLLQTDLPPQFEEGFDFPVLVLDWESFGVTASGILGTGITTLKERDQSRVGIEIAGQRNLKGYQQEFGGGAGQRYEFTLANIRPDEGTVAWHTSGPEADQGSTAIAPLSQSGNLDVNFSLPLKPNLETYAFVLEADATETCAKDKSKKLSASASIHVSVEVDANPTTAQ